MDFFEHNLGPPNRGRLGAYIWVRDRPYTPREEWLDAPIDSGKVEADPTRYLCLMWIADQFICGNPDCASMDVVCIWCRYDGIDLGVDQTFGEFRCPDCARYTFVEYQRDSS